MITKKIKQFMECIANSLNINSKLTYHNQLMQIDIQDDPSKIYAIYQELRGNLGLDIAQSLDQRQKALKRLLEGYEAFKPQIDEALKQDLGYSPFLSNFAAHSICFNQIKDLLDNFRSWAKPRSVKTPIAIGLASSKVEYEPLGVVLVLSAWNYPILTALTPVASAICAGNSVILKPSELSPYSSRVLAKLFEEYMDPRFYRVVEGKVKVAQTLSKLKFDIICFTGSTETGRLVAIEAAKNLTPCILQLGGKCPVIVDETANLESAALRIIFGKFLNCGQTCVGVDHLYIHESIYDKFKKVLLLQVNNAFDKQDLLNSGDYGKINNLNHLKRLKGFLNEDHKGKIIYGGNIIEDKLHFGPTIVQKPKEDSLLMKNQIFGPIMPIQSYSNLKDLVTELRGKPKPLVVYHFSNNSKNIDFVKNHTSSGAFVTNDTVVQNLNNHLPFGGVGQSGYGRYHGQAGFINFSNPKSICYTEPFNAYPLNTRFGPYTDSKKRVLNFLLKIGGSTYTDLKRGSIILSVIIAAAIAYLKIRPHL